MRKLTLISGLALAAIACATGADMVGEIMDSGVPDAGAQPTPKPVGTFVGYTSEGYALRATGDSSGGIFNTYAACQADFGETARICTVTEVLGTVNLPAPPPERDNTAGTEPGAWLIANNLDTAPDCWGGGPLEAPWLTPIGSFSSDNCGDSRVLACCTVE